MTTSPARRHSPIAAAAFAIATLLLLAIAGAAVILATDSYDPLRARVDLTALREHALSERTVRILSRLDSPCRAIVVAGPTGAAADASARRALRDVLAELERSSPNLTLVWADAATAGGRRALEQSMADLANERRAAIEEQRAILSGAIESAEAIASSLATVNSLLLRARDASASAEERERFERFAALARVRAGEISQAAQAGASAAVSLGGQTIADVAEAQRALGEPLSSLGAELGDLVTALGQAASADAQEAARLVGAARDRALAAGDALARLDPVDLIAAARMLETTSAVLLATGDGLVGVPFDNLFVPGEPDAPPRFAGEELLATGLAALTSAASPIAILTHSLATPLFDDQGQPTGPDAQDLVALRARLASLRIEAVEWAIGAQEDRPTLETIDPTGERPRVWIIIPSAAAAPGGSERAAALGAALESLLTGGESALVTVEPSPMPAYGAPDPTIAPLEPWGIRVDSGRPLLRRESRADGQTVVGAARLVGGETESPIGRAVRGLGVLLPWPTPITLGEAPEGVRRDVVLEQEPTANVWGESQWLAYRSLPPAQQRRLENQPAPDPSRDSVTGPWILAISAERQRPTSEEAQRIVVVGSHGWFFDPIAEEAAVLDGRRVLRQPGNGELLEASVLWLAGQDDLIAPGPRARQTPRIRPIEPGALLALRWALIAGLPIGALSLGALWRLLRG